MATQVLPSADVAAAVESAPSLHCLQAGAHHVAGLGSVSPLQQPSSPKQRSPSPSASNKPSYPQHVARIVDTSVSPSEVLFTPDSQSRTVHDQGQTGTALPLQHIKAAAHNSTLTACQSGCDPDGYCTAADHGFEWTAEKGTRQCQGVLQVRSSTASACDPDQYCNVAPLEAATTPEGELASTFCICRPLHTFCRRHDICCKIFAPVLMPMSGQSMYSMPFECLICYFGCVLWQWV